MPKQKIWQNVQKPGADQAASKVAQMIDNNRIRACLKVSMTHHNEDSQNSPAQANPWD
jgi:hypothetical protein